MSDQSQEPDESLEGTGTPVVESDSVDDEYDLTDVVEADYYGTDDDESDEVTA
jgi:hypothetical protein